MVNGGRCVCDGGGGHVVSWYGMAWHGMAWVVCCGTVPPDGPRIKNGSKPVSLFSSIVPRRGSPPWLSPNSV